MEYIFAGAMLLFVLIFAGGMVGVLAIVDALKSLRVPNTEPQEICVYCGCAIQWNAASSRWFRVGYMSANSTRDCGDHCPVLPVRRES